MQEGNKQLQQGFRYKKSFAGGDSNFEKKNYQLESQHSFTRTKPRTIKYVRKDRIIKEDQELEKTRVSTDSDASTLDPNETPSIPSSSASDTDLNYDAHNNNKDSKDSHKLSLPTSFYCPKIAKLPVCPASLIPLPSFVGN